jgi:K+-sensing histidine kinase KdpD
MGTPPDQEPGELEAFAGAVAHELRTPLAALSGEVEIVLRRERTAPAYREALSRIAVSVAELVALTGDLMLLGQTSGRESLGKRARLETLLADVAERCRASTGNVVSVESGATAVVVVGDETQLGRALMLVLEHAVRHRKESGRVRLRAVSPQDLTTTRGPVDLEVDSVPAGFWPQAWQFLTASGADGEPTRPLSGPLRLRTADRIVRDSGGSLQVTTKEGTQAVRIRLQCAEVV